MDPTHVPIERLWHKFLAADRTLPLDMLSILWAAAFMFLLVPALLVHFAAVLARDHFAWILHSVLLSPEKQLIHQLTCNRYMKKTIDTSIDMETYLWRERAWDVEKVLSHP